MTSYEMEMQEDGTIVAVNGSGETIPLKLGPSLIRDQLGIPVVDDDGSAKRDSVYLNKTEGRVKFKDESGAVHAGDESLWKETDDGSAIEPATEDRAISVERSVTERYPVVEVDAFGATGDGSTDDTQAIRDAVNSVPDGEKAILALSAGKKYYISGSVTIDPSNIIGIDARNAYILSDQDIVFVDVEGNNPSGFDSGPGSDIEGQQLEEFNFFIRDLQCYSTTSPYVGTGIQLSQMMSARVEGCHLTKLDKGIAVTGDNRNLTIHGCNIYDNGGTGVYFGSGETHQVLINDNHIAYAVRPIHSDQHSIYNLHIDGCDIESGVKSQNQTVHLIDIDAGGGSVHEVSITGSTVQDHSSNSGALIRFSGVQDVMIDGNPQISNSGSDGILLTNLCEDVTITDTHFKQIDGAVIVGASGGVRSRFALKNNTVRKSGRFLDFDLSESFLIQQQIVGNEVQFQDAPVLRLDNLDSSNNMRSARVQGNQFYGDSGASPTAGSYVVDIRATEVSELKVRDNAAYVRGWDLNGYRVDVSTAELFHLKDNSVRDIPSTNTAFDFPSASSGNVITGGNISSNP